MRGPLAFVFCILLFFSSGTMSICDPGFGPKQDGARCEICPNGTSSSDGTECVSCPVNTYASLSGSSECVVCPAKTRTENVGSDACRVCKLGDVWEVTPTTCEDFWSKMMPFGSSTVLPRPTGQSSDKHDMKEAYISGTAIGVVAVASLFGLVLAVIIRLKIVKRSSYTKYEAVDNGNIITVNFEDSNEEREQEVSL